jgi:hypothetical protein
MENELPINSEEPTECPICYDLFELDDSICRFNCNHVLCMTCDDICLKNSINSCPLCRSIREQSHTIVPDFNEQIVGRAVRIVGRADQIISRDVQLPIESIQSYVPYVPVKKPKKIKVNDPNKYKQAKNNWNTIKTQMKCQRRY